MTEVAASAIVSPQPGAGDTPIANMNAEQALARHREIMSDPNKAEWREAFAKGDLAKRDELAQLHRIIEGTTPENLQATAEARVVLERERVVDHLRNTADIPEPVADMIRKDTPVSAHERRMAEQERGRLMADPDFVKGWLSGKRDARTRMALVDVILARPVIRQ